MSTLHTDLSTASARHTEPLNPYAHRFWKSHQWQPKHNKHNLSVCFTIKGALDTQRLRTACQQYAERVQPQILGSVQVLDDHPHVVPGKGNIDWQTVACTGLSAAASAPFALDQAPLSRFCIARQSAEEHVLLITLPHFLADMTTAHIIVSKIGQYYRHPTPQSTTDASPPVLTLSTDETDAGNVLVTAIDLPIAPTPSRCSHWVTPQHSVLDAATTQRLKRHAKALGTTPFVVLMSCWGWLLGHLAHQQDITLHFPIDARPATQKPRPGLLDSAPCGVTDDARHTG